MALSKILSKKKDKHRRVAVIGLSGVSWNLTRDLSARGIMPNLAGLLQDGFACEMTSSLPSVSSVAWTSFLTGVNPGQHGIFGFAERRRESYGLYFPNASQVQSPALWDLLSKKDLKTVAVNIPQTYPVSETNGITIAGYMADNLEKAVYPPRLVPALQELDYRIDVDLALAGTDKDAFMQGLSGTLRKRRDTIVYLLDRIDWNLFVGVFTGCERLLRYFWADYENTSSPYHQRVMGYFKDIDSAIGEMVSRLSEEDGLIILSDYGISRLEKEVYLNAWLQHEGLLNFKGDPPYSYENIDGERTWAFALDPGRIYINLKGSMPQGSVEPGEEYEGLLKELNAAFLSLKDDVTGEPVISRLFRKNDLFSGPSLERAPDFVLRGAQGYDLKGAVSQEAVFANDLITGMSVYSEPLFYMRGLQGLSVRPRIIDIAPTILRLLNMSVPGSMDGKALI